MKKIEVNGFSCSDRVLLFVDSADAGDTDGCATKFVLFLANPTADAGGLAHGGRSGGSAIAEGRAPTGTTSAKQRAAATARCWKKGLLGSIRFSGLGRRCCDRLNQGFRPWRRRPFVFAGERSETGGRWNMPSSGRDRVRSGVFERCGDGALPARVRGAPSVL